MIVIQVTQTVEREGIDRKFQYHVTEAEFSQKMDRLHRAFSPGTKIEWCDCGKGDYCPQFGKSFGLGERGLLAHDPSALKVCRERGFHRPTGPVQAFRTGDVTTDMRQCRDCRVWS